MRFRQMLVLSSAGLLRQIDCWRWRQLFFNVWNYSLIGTASYHTSPISSASPLWEARISHFPVISCSVWWKQFVCSTLVDNIHRSKMLRFKFQLLARTGFRKFIISLYAFTAYIAPSTAAGKELKVHTAHWNRHYNVSFSPLSNRNERRYLQLE
jgi:hypothetical protein